jgi:hypothetical protein
MKLFSYTPIECLNGEFEFCDRLVAYARFDIHKQQVEQALL